MSGWRLVVDRGSYADFSVSVSPAVEKAVVRGEAPPTVFLNIFDSDSITIGVNEDPEQVLDLDFCRVNGIDFRRRVNGGGPIYAGAGSAFLIYFLPLSHPEVPGTTEQAFIKILGAVADVFRDRYGFPAEYRPLNDIQVEGRKLVPTSLKIEDGVMTLRIVVNVKPIDTELAGKAMPMPPEKVRDKALKTLESRFTWLEREAGREIDETGTDRLRPGLHRTGLRRIGAGTGKAGRGRTKLRRCLSRRARYGGLAVSGSPNESASPIRRVPATCWAGAARRPWAA